MLNQYVVKLWGAAGGGVGMMAVTVNKLYTICMGVATINILLAQAGDIRNEADGQSVKCRARMEGRTLEPTSRQQQ